ncbi:hypothetical protein [Hymenobacter guriensis]|uniref:Lipoprotein n=1 Tax=Hymenobacter guriensis TaxID=2793065 RepID=A0ABS0L8H9_9BACT|nr:hypothetical protein [Hymenobacter guriensis]MBG8555704.1 hypothetical protein [Hymenobacter guriensis]
MKKFLLLACMGVAGLASCRTQCPAYTSVKPAAHQASPIMASAADAAPRQ